MKPEPNHKTTVTILSILSILWIVAATVGSCLAVDIKLKIVLWILAFTLTVGAISGIVITDERFYR